MLPIGEVPIPNYERNTSLFGAEKLVFNLDSFNLLSDIKNNFKIINFGGNSKYQSIFEQNLTLNRR